MKLKMAENSLFAVLLRSPWWVSLLIAAVLGAAAAALLPGEYKLVGAMSGLPFAVIAALAARRQWHLPSAARVAEVRQAVAAMAWPKFASLLEQAFARDGYRVQRGQEGAAADFVIERQGRAMAVGARRWKSARVGVEVLRMLQAAREGAGEDGAPDALFVALGELSDGARAYAREHRIAVWQAAEIAQALRGIKVEG